ncbi:glutaredoxin family protein [Alkalihalophilus sp. As8PL]|uniref:Glutaredoxin family protein n=1 Tax=Alkalihalophilus sp. As8PL TaxID=3237103 RepID=A0AB39BPV1_9BACI
MAILYTISGCIRCEQAKNTLTSQGVSYEEVNILEHPARQTEIRLIHHEVITPIFFSKGRKWLFEDMLFLEMRNGYEVS